MGPRWNGRASGRQNPEARGLLAPVYGWFTEGFRHARSEGLEGAAGGVGVIMTWQDTNSDVLKWSAGQFRFAEGLLAQLGR
jgi:hypothetical protein